MSDVQNDIRIATAFVSGHFLSSDSEVKFSLDGVVANENNIICNLTLGK